MSQPSSFLSGEYRRVYDDRYRIALPPELAESIAGESEDCVLAKEREGCLSLWNAEFWNKKIRGRVDLIRQKLELDVLEHGDLVKLQRFSRLLSTRSRPVKLGGRSRLLIPEGFREFLAVEPNSEVILLGAGICLEIWNPKVWFAYLPQDIGNFHELVKELGS